MKELIRIKTIMQKYQGFQRQCGELDCSLLWGELYEPELYKQFVGRYTSIRGGARIMKQDIGVSTVGKYMKDSDKYTQIDPNFKQAGDILIHGVHVYIWLGQLAFGVDEAGTFNVIPINHDPEITVYRKE